MNRDAPPSPQRSRHAARLVVAGSLVLAALWLLSGILVALAWAVVIAIATWPLYRWLRTILGQSPTLSSIVFTLLVGAILLTLGVFVMIEVGRDGPTVVRWITEAQQSGIAVPNWLDRIPLLGSYARDWWGTHLGDPQALGTLFQGVDQNSLATWTSSLGGQILHRLFLIGLMLVVLFFLLRDGERVGTRLLTVADGWLGTPGERLAEKMVEGVRGTVVGTLAVAFGEGLIIGAAYLVTGVPHAVLFGLVTTAFALVPFGAWVMFTVATLTLYATTGSALLPLVLFAFSAGVMLVGDNIVQPTLIGGAARVPFVWALLGIIGGLESLGLIGLFIGPVIMAALLTLWREWGDVVPRRSEGAIGARATTSSRLGGADG